MRPPAVSVIIATYNASRTVRNCLESLERQTRRDFETLVVDSSRDATAALVAREFPRVRRIRSGRRLFCGEARNRGLRLARASIVAFLDADCVASPDWVERLAAAHHAAGPVIGGAVENARPRDPVSTAAHLSEFSRWTPDRAAGPVPDLAGANLSYRKHLFARHGGFIEGVYGSDTEHHWRLAARGIPILFDPRMRVFHAFDGTAGGWIRHERAHGRDFAGVRAEARGFSGIRRAAHFMCWPAAAFKLFAAVLARTCRNARGRKALGPTWPLLAAGLLAWAYGEAEGMIGGTRSRRPVPRASADPSPVRRRLQAGRSARPVPRRGLPAPAPPGPRVPKSPTPGKALE